MPVLIVSEKTWPHDGFSRKRSTRPSSSVTTIPNSSGFVDRLEPDRDGGALLAVELDELAEVEVAERVARDDEEGLVELVALPAAPSRPSRAATPRPSTRCSRRGSRRRRSSCGSPAAGTRRVTITSSKPCRVQELDDVLHARLADDRHHRLRLVRGQRAQARALPAGHDDGFHRRTARQSASTM